MSGLRKEESALGPGRVELIRVRIEEGIQGEEGVAVEQRQKVTEGIHDEDEDDCEVEREEVATEQSGARKVAEHEANERGRVPEPHAVRTIEEREQGGSHNPGGGANAGARRAGRAFSSKNHYDG